MQKETAAITRLDSPLPLRIAGEGELTGSAARFWQMVEPFKHMLFSFIHKSLNFSDESHDVFQETVLRAFTYLNSFHSECSFQTWIFAIAHNEIRKHYRNLRKQPLRMTEEDWNRLPIAPAEAKATRELHEIAEHLPPRQREVFFLFYGQGFSLREIRGITGFSTGYIKFILNRARNAVKKMVGEQS